jgi:hypothetical protein
MDKKRDLHSKEKFMEGNRQRWLVVFMACMFIVLVLDATGHVQKVDSYLTFLTFLSGAFILGYSGTETMKLFSVSSTSQNVSQNIKQESKSESTQTIHTIEEKLTHNVKEDDYKV